MLARFLADHDRNLAEAITLAEAGAISRRDIFTMDTLAWSYFKAGRLNEARAAMTQAIRTGSVDARILYHAAEIQAAVGETAQARATLRRIPAPDAIADLRVARAVRQLQSRLPG